jgi:hypothetical protein
MGPKGKRSRVDQDYPKYGICIGCHQFGDGKRMKCNCGKMSHVLIKLGEAVDVLGTKDIPSPLMLSLAQVYQLLKAREDAGMLKEGFTADFVYRVKHDPNHRYNKCDVEGKLAILAKAQELELIEQQALSRAKPKSAIASRKLLVDPDYDSDGTMAVNLGDMKNCSHEEMDAMVDLIIDDQNGEDSCCDEADWALPFGDFSHHGDFSIGKEYLCKAEQTLHQARKMLEQAEMALQGVQRESMEYGDRAKVQEELVRGVWVSNQKLQSSLAKFTFFIEPERYQRHGVLTKLAASLAGIAPGSLEGLSIDSAKRIVKLEDRAEATEHTMKGQQEAEVAQLLQDQRDKIENKDIYSAQARKIAGLEAEVKYLRERDLKAEHEEDRLRSVLNILCKSRRGTVTEEEERRVETFVVESSRGTRDVILPSE